MKYQAPRGTHDILTDESRLWVQVEDAFREVCRRYGYGEIRTPIVEDTELFVRTVGESSDIVTKQMYTFQDPGGRSLTLRAEGTAPTVRAYLEHSLAQQSPLTKLFYICPIFRYERPAAGRYRQHHQVGVEAIGAADPAIDVEIILLGRDYLDAIGITGSELLLNSVGCPVCRQAYRQALRDALAPALGDLCGDCRRRYEQNPQRMLDCKRESCRALMTEAPRGRDYLCAECAQHFETVQNLLAEFDTPFTIDDHLVRGLDYYTKTAFEFTHTAGLGAQAAIIGGGRYDGLVADCGGKPTPGIGFGSGIERVLLVREALAKDTSRPPAVDVFVVALGESARLSALRVLRQLRLRGVAADTDYLGRSLKSQMKQADRLGAAHVVILGEQELERQQAVVRDMAASQQRDVAIEQVAEVLAESLRSRRAG